MCNKHRSGDNAWVMAKRAAIVQSNYIPWKGYFDLIASVEDFVLYDDVQFTKNDWRNRNRIKAQSGVEWLSVPVGQCISRRVRDVMISDDRWQRQHWSKLQTNYGKARCFRSCAEWLRPLYLERNYGTLSELNRTLLEAICGRLGIHTRLHWSWDFETGEGKTSRLVELCKLLGADEYVSGPAARSYLDEQCFVREGISVSWYDYSGYPEYPQLWGAFDHAVSIVDLLFNTGEDSRLFMKLNRRIP